MEKLISANKFISEIVTLANEAHFDYHDLHFSTNDVLDNIDGQPEVEAIPVKWMLERLRKKLTPHEKEFMVKLINEYNAERHKYDR